MSAHRINAFFESLEHRTILPISHTYLALKRICVVIGDPKQEAQAMERLAKVLNLDSAEALVTYVLNDPWYIAEMKRGQEEEPPAIPETPRLVQPRVFGGWLVAQPVRSPQEEEAYLLRYNAWVQRAVDERAKNKAKKAESRQKRSEKAQRHAFGIARARQQEDEMLARNMQPWCPIEPYGSRKVLHPKALVVLLKNRGYHGRILDTTMPWRQIFACMLHGIPLYQHWLNNVDRDLLKRSGLREEGRELAAQSYPTNALIKRCYEQLIRENSSEAYNFAEDEFEDTTEGSVVDPVLQAQTDHNTPTCPGGIERVVVRRKRIIHKPSSD